MKMEDRLFLKLRWLSENFV